MENLNLNQLENINGGSTLGWATATATQLGLAAAATAEVPPLSAGLAAGAVLAGGVAVYEAWH
ncbi:bacteriocin [Clostridium perfringens]|uniref:bacteriocin n=1 Tax=Clostridium perfringens TaxID=1502 RepID=UPI0010EBE08C|nr:bacteriocin [Clostridium perfringens]CAG9354397.1 bacteriocin [Clostridium perfringens]VTR81662.1 bacteriocin [Clostridium perfringens]HBI6984431.1 bacteriocin [Clostridium perfringens]